MVSSSLGEVYRAHEVALAVGIPLEQVEVAMATGELRSVRRLFVRHADAVAWGRRLRRTERANEGGRDESLTAAAAVPALALEPPALFEPPPGAPRATAFPAAISAGVHLAVGLGAVLVTIAGFGAAAPAGMEYRLAEPMRLVFLAIPGPGGGGGGGGLRQPTPPRPAKREGNRALSSPLPEREPPPPVKPPEPDARPPLPAEELPPIVAPVATSASDDEDKPGVLEQTDDEGDSRGPGEGGGVGEGRGTGLGEGNGSGIGPGEGGGIGGGPYRPGSGIAPPRLLREVKPEYTEEARRKGLVGEVILEIVVRYDGRVGEVRVLDGLGAGLDERAAEAVRQWRFSPATRLGKPVDVLVEVAVEFRLR